MNVYQAVSYNRVPPPPAQVVSQIPLKVKVLVAGTSLCNRSLDKNHLAEETNTLVEKVKLFTISGGPYRPELNLFEKLTPEFCEPFKIVIIETGVNEISNLSTLVSDQENLKILGEKVKTLVSLADALGKAGKHVILLNRIDRLDEKKRWNGSMDKAMEERILELDNGNVKNKDLGIKCSRLQAEMDLFGKGTSVFDGIHLRGPSGRRIFTAAFVQMLRSLVLTKVVVT